MTLLAILFFLVTFALLLSGYPVAFILGGSALLFALIGSLSGHFDTTLLITALPNRIYGIMENQTLIAVPLFVFMGVMLERSKIAENLLDTMTQLFGSIRGGMGISVIVVGALLAASTGIVGATVVTLGLLSLPTMLKRGYNPAIAAGTLCASGTLGQIIPPSIILVLLGDVLSSAYQEAQRSLGIFAPDTVSVGDLFIGAVIPGGLLVLLYILFIIAIAWLKPEHVPALAERSQKKLLQLQFIYQISKVLMPPLVLMLAVLGSIIAGIATPTESASVGAVGATVLALIYRRLNWAMMRQVVRTTTQISAMVFMILIAATTFALVFRGFGGDTMVHQFLKELPGGPGGAMLTVMLVMFLLGFVLDFIEITFIVVPIVAPVLLAMGFDPVWLGIMIAINLQTSFLTPPFGFALFYLRGVAPKELETRTLYKGVVPFIAIQLFAMVLLALWPQIVTWLPHQLAH